MLDALCSGFCGVLVGLINRLCEKLNVNPFFSTISAAFIMAVPAYLMGSVGICRNSDAVIIGALMILVPGASLYQRNAGHYLRGYQFRH